MEKSHRWVTVIMGDPQGQYKNNTVVLINMYAYHGMNDDDSSRVLTGDAFVDHDEGICKRECFDEG